MIGFTAKNVWLALLDAVLRRAPRPVRALAYVRENAREGDPDDVLAKLDDFATNVRWLMSIGPAKDKVLLEARSRLQGPIRVLELGAYAGYSSIFMASVFGDDSEIVSVEICSQCVDAARGNIAHAGLNDRIKVISGPSSDVITTLEKPFDLVFLDHWKHLYLEDLKALEQRNLLRRGTLIVADNVGEVFGAHQYLDYVRGCGHYDNDNFAATIEYTNFPDAVEISTYRGQ
eukprot:CAMPEP_0113549574 /NCGR_PEP_ID=MMETSP0015_2-20120614/13507_1 /TAXON_ID=2838 /ORGANISM="Odontella" /LENGTH=230 /DNA_ID=CAMNT_0000450295 /DNA_START=135 /DNA_END=827 /DNA_ORIENTATION=+ /assembly_acc=CAM_ASM_000160